MNLTSDDVRDILRLLDTLPFDELHLETGGFRLSLRRTADGEWTQATQVLSAPTGFAPTGTAEKAPVASRSEDDDPPARAVSVPGSPEIPKDGLVEVRAPLLGTFYRAPRPGAAPFVEVGSAVHDDTIVGIIETMKLMNSVPAGVRGTVMEICVGDAEFAAQDAVLMRVDPAVPGPEAT